MRVIWRILCVITALSLLCGGAYAAGGQDDGLIRVYLKSLGDVEAICLTMAGEYVIENSDAIRFDRGAVAAVCADGEDVLVSVGGMTLNMGKSVTFTRCASGEEENGLYIHESQKHALYEGDLTVGNAGGKLRCLLTIGVEDYLKGVVAYEMSDSFPLEALKAQAVAARTYAMSRKAARTGEDYDVTDTTSDQVYKGYIADYENVVRAVEETAGIVGTYNGKYAVCYYTASNGGQVATPGQIWGGDGDYGYIEQKDDPYDLENELSLVNSFAVPREPHSENFFWDMLIERVSQEKNGIIRIDSIADMTVEGEKFEGSLMKETLKVYCNASAKKYGFVEAEFDGRTLDGLAQGLVRLTDGKWYSYELKDWESLAETVCVEFSVYEDIKDGLDMGLNSRDYEVASVSEDGDMFLIEMRRFGHGVGMSQRGAQVMAGKYEKDFREILGFYYPGMVLEEINWNEPLLPEMEELPGALIRERLLIPPMAGNLEPLEDGEYYARVTLESAKSRLNVRIAPSTQSDVLCQLTDDYRVVVRLITDEGWARIRGNGFEGFVKEEYLIRE